MKTFYIVPGWEDTGKEEGYQMLANEAEKKGYTVEIKPIDWTKPLSTQTFAIAEDAVMFGFSLGAILAWLIAQQTKCRLLILASMTPHYSFTDVEIRKALVELAGEEFVADIITHLTDKNNAEKQIVMYGDKEDEPADVLVLDTEHEITSNYVTSVMKLI